MPFGATRALVLETNLAVHGVDVVVTRPAPEDTPIATRGIWLTPVTEGVPIGGESARREPKRVLALSRAVVPTVPRGTLVQAPPKAGDADVMWRVDGLETLEPDHTRCWVVPAPDVDVQE